MTHSDKIPFVHVYEHVTMDYQEGKVRQDTLSSDHIIAAIKKVYRHYYRNENDSDIEQVDISHLSEQEQIIKFSKSIRLRAKPVVVESSWWQSDGGALLVFDKIAHLPWVLLPSKNGAYCLYDIAKQKKSAVTIADAALFEPQGYAFYPQFEDKPINWKQLLQFAGQRSIEDIRRVVGLQIVISLVALLLPLMTGFLIDYVIPNAAYGLLTQATLFLVVATLAGGIFFFTQLLCTLRFTIKMDYRAQTAVWDRLIRLPLKFFRNYDTGDLINRAEGISDIQQALGSSIILSITSSLVGIFSIVLMFYYSVYLAIIAMIFIAIISTVVFLMLSRELGYQKLITKLYGKIEALLLQMISGMGKIKITNSKNIFFEQWLKIFQEKYRNLFLSGRLMVYMESFYLLMGPLITIVFFAVVSTQLSKLPLGHFIAFSALFGQLFVAIDRLLNASLSIVAIIPLYQRISPILITAPEPSQMLLNPGQMTGHIEVNQVSFRYHDNDPFLLHQCQLTILPRQHVAIVASSGTGKTTLLRLLLGLEHPEAGHISYDGIDLRYLNPEMLRRQFGVVLQSNRLMAGTIADNIGGFRHVGSQELWYAARMACIDAEIEAMPMGMQSYVDENGSLFSGGQRQRIMLARALCTKPRILFLDEATSALDNVTQLRIQKNLDTLNITCVSIAHRLSTIVYADVIYVLDGGGVVQQGNYRDLLADTEGLFYHLAKHQLAR